MTAKRIYYRNFVTGKRQWTAGGFVGWARGGILNAWGAIIQRQASILFIPVYLIEPTTQERLPPLPKEN